MDHKNEENDDKVTTLLKLAHKNALNDRSRASDILCQIEAFIQDDPPSAFEFASMLPKYYDTLYKSNEQLIKIATVFSKHLGPAAGDNEITAEDIEDIYDEVVE